MNWSVAAVAFCAFFGGLLLVSRVIAWVADLVLVFKPSGAKRTALGLAQLFLHSGPWSLALAIGAIYYVASLSQPALFWALVAGFSVAVILLVAAIAIVRYRQRQGKMTLVPLTPERLRTIRRRFFWGTSMYSGGAMAAWMLYQMWPYFGRDVFLIAIVVAICLGGGYVFSWFMWQWYGASLQAREDARRRAERQNAV